MQYTSHYESPLGPILLSSDGEALTGLWFEGQRYFALHLDSEHEDRELPVFDLARAWLDEYFSGNEPSVSIPLHVDGSPFHKEVASIMLAIPYGKTMTYGEIASLIAERHGMERMSARAVGGAVGHNEISLIIPCHRVVGSSGSLTGYGGGIWRKVRLLEGEGVDMSKFHIPSKGTAL